MVQGALFTAVPTLAMLLLSLVLVVILLLGATKLSGRALAILAGCGLLLLPLLWMVSYSSVPVVQTVSHPGAAHASSESTVEKELSLDAEWERLTRSRIVLDDASSTELENEATKAADSAADPSPQVAEVSRPDWIDNPPKMVGNVYRKVVASGPYRTVEECHQALEGQLQEVVRERILQLEPGSSAESVENFGVGLDYILHDICRNGEWVETVEASFGEMKQVFLQMQFDPAVDKQLRQAYRTQVRQQRVTHVAGTAGAVLGLVLLVFGLLKADTWTRGYYSKQLFFGVPAAIIGLIVLFLS